MFKGFLIDIKEWVLETARSFRHELHACLNDVGVMIFFLFLPLAYPLIYSLIYNTEVTRDMPVVVVDKCRTAETREFVRHADATEAIRIAGYAANLQEAKEAFMAKDCFGILEIPSDYSQKMMRLEQPQVQFYCNMTLLLRYRTFVSSLTELQIATGAQLRERALSDLGMPPSKASSEISSIGYALGDTQQGFASFIIPGIVILILQQSMLLGITMMGGARQEKRRIRGPLPIDALSPSAQIFGRTFAYVLIYIPLTIYILDFVPAFFNYPHHSDLLTDLLAVLPMLLATAMMGQTLNIMANERESSFVIVVFTSVLFLFLSGLTWPRFAMNGFLTVLGDFVPATWGIDSFVRINSNGASMGEQKDAWLWLWLLFIVYTAMAYLVVRIQTSRTIRRTRRSTAKTQPKPAE